MPDQQQQINYGAAPNDGQGDPLRDAFIKTDDNFDAIWNAGPVGSNITILNNTVGVVNTNGNLVLRPNGVGVIQANATVTPDSANIRDLGAADRRWRRVYLQTLNTVDYEVEGNLTVSGNLTIQGDTIQVGNLITDARTLQLANTAASSAQANGSGITVGASDDIATILYDSDANVWQINLGIQASGNISADNIDIDGNIIADNIDINGNISADNIDINGNIVANYFLGNGSQLTGLPEQYGDANVVSLLADFGSNNIVTTGNVEAERLQIQNGVGNVWTIYQDSISAPSGGEWRSENDSLDDFITSAANGYINMQSLFADGNIASELKLEHGVAKIVVADGPFNEWTFGSNGNLTTPGGILPEANAVYSLGSESLQWADLWVANNTIYIGGVPLGVSGNVLTVNGEPVLSNDSNIAIITTGNITADYFFGNGSQLTGLNTSSISNGTSNVDIATANGNVTVTANSSATWNFATDGNLLLPQGGIVSEGASPTGLGNTVAIAPSGGSDPDQQLLVYPTVGEGNHLHLTSGNLYNTELYLGNDNLYVKLTNTGNVVINSNDGAGNTGQWTFDTTGNLTLPGAAAGETIATSDGYITVGNLLIGQGGALFNTNNDSWALFGNRSDPGTSITIPSNDSAGNGQSLIIENQISNVEIVSGLNTWNFDNTGNLTLPLGGIVYETSIPGGTLAGNTIALKPQGGIDADQQLLIYPTAAPGTDDNHLHLTTGNLYNTELFLGNDNLYVKLANTGNVVVNSNDAAGNAAQWTFDNFGTLTLPGGSRIRPLGANLDIFAGTGSYVNLITADESSSMGVDNSGGYIVTAGGTWDFDTTGNLTVPGNINFGGDASAGPSLNDFASVTSAANFAIVTDSANTNQIWNFDSTGNLTLPGNIAGNTNGFAIGYRDIPQVSLAANATISTSDAGKHYYSVSSSTLTLTVANNASQNFAVGSAISIVNQGTGNITLAQGSGVALYLAGNATAGNRTISTFGMATIMKVATDTWFINGTGVS